MARTRQTRATIEVKVARVGGEVKELMLETGATVEEALDASTLEWSDSMRIRVNGEAAELDDELEDGDVITIAGKVKGGVA